MLVITYEGAGHQKPELLGRITNPSTMGTWHQAQLLGGVTLVVTLGGKLEGGRGGRSPLPLPRSKAATTTSWHGVGAVPRPKALPPASIYLDHG